MSPQKSVTWWLSGCVALLLSAGPALAQSGNVTGVVTQSGTGQPLDGAVVQLEGTSFSAVTRENGRYLLMDVPAGTYTLVVQMIGHAEARQQITVSAGQVTQANVIMQQEAISLQEIVVTGTAGAMAKVKTPFEVATVQAAEMPVPTVNVASALQGKVAGVSITAGSGQPGEDVSILLRGPKSINAEGRNQEPLYVVDGVIISSGLADLGSLDIESVEILKGAAAASLYGSRAANGVIQIRSRRGSQLQDGNVRYTVRTEIGMSDLPNPSPDLLPEHHEWKIENGKFVDADGTPCDWLECDNPQLAGQAAAPGEPATVWNTYMTNEWPGQTFDQAKRFFTGGDFLQTYASATGRAGATNFHLSVSNVVESGIMRFFDGYKRTNFRLNVDQAVNEKVLVQGSAFYSRSESDQFNAGGVLFDLTRMPAGVDLLGPDPEDPDEVILLPDPTNTESPNPIYELLARDYSEKRSRFLGSLNVRYSPFEWLDVIANGSWDRLDLAETDLYPKGYRTISPSQALNNGNLEEFSRVDEGLNASIMASMRFQLTDNIANRTQIQYLYEAQDREQFESGGYRFAVAGVPVLDNVDPTTLESASYMRTIRSDGYFAITNFDIADRYVIDALIRNDGSSLFGEDERRQWYYRVAGAWRVTGEPWFTVPGIDELKLRYSVGTAGGRPRFEAQYETYSVSGGRVTPVNLGNRELRPEHSTEHEAGVDAILLGNRVQLGVTYAQTTTRDQILPVPLPAMSGFGTQWRNAGTMESKTWEVTLEGQLVRTEDLLWSARLLFDRTRTFITELNQPAFSFGVDGQGLGDVFYARPGEEYGTMYGQTFAKSCADLPEGVDCSQFTVDENGWLVWVGDGSLADQRWGEVAPFTVEGTTVKWGTPFVVRCTDRETGERTLFCPVGNTMPDYSASLASTLTWKGFTVYGLLDAVQGFHVYNQPLQWAIFQRTAGIMDEAGTPEAHRKPIGYYDDLYHAGGGLNPSNAFVEDASFVKLREVSIAYRFSREQLAGLPWLGGLQGLTLNLSGRNLATWTDYRGFDPEVGESGGDTGSSGIARVEGYQYPNFRTITASVEINF
ncbi:MAG TPA: SusC/RagA family TonB-linked outer membrane protein [Longimicrobiales bacterium]